MINFQFCYAFFSFLWNNAFLVALTQCVAETGEGVRMINISWFEFRVLGFGFLVLGFGSWVLGFRYWV